jgi:integrase
MARYTDRVGSLASHRQARSQALASRSDRCRQEWHCGAQHCGRPCAASGPARRDRDIDARADRGRARQARGHNLFPIVSLALASGLRRGELLALQWGCVDLDGGSIRVERSLEETKGGLAFKGPKSSAGKRTIPLPAQAVAMLRAHKVGLLEIRLALGMGNIAPETLVFSDVEGDPLKPHTVSRAWRRVVTSKKLPRVSFHALRHTHASILIRAGVDVLTISKRLGHHKPSVTLDLYAHILPGSDEAAARAIERVLK